MKHTLDESVANELKMNSQELSSLAGRLGNLELELLDIQAKKEELKNLHVSLVAQRNRIHSELLQQYGEGTLDVSTGEFTTLA